MTFQTITAEQTGRVLVVTLNRPDNMNAINLELARELCQIAEQTGQKSRHWRGYHHRGR